LTQTGNQQFVVFSSHCRRFQRWCDRRGRRWYSVPLRWRDLTFVSHVPIFY